MYINPYINILTIISHPRKAQEIRRVLGAASAGEVERLNKELGGLREKLERTQAFVLAEIGPK